LQQDPRHPQYSQLLGCGGGLTDIAHYDMRDIGVAEGSCGPYKTPNYNCSNVCDDGSKTTLSRIRDVYDMYKPFDISYTVRAIQTEIMTHGPVTATMNAFYDFINYAGGIYSPLKGRALFTPVITLHRMGRRERNALLDCCEQL